jgi:RNA polymerase sigma-70 factor (ECF subfamily)
MKARDENSDAELIRAYQAGRPQAFDQLLQRYQSPLFAYLLRWAEERPVAEDLFQETFVRVIRALPHYHEQERFGSWLFGIAHRLCIDHARKRQTSRTYFSEPAAEAGRAGDSGYADQEPTPHDLLEQKEVSALIALAVQEMPTDLKEVFLLRQHSGMPFREIAALLERPLNTVLGRMRLAVLYLREYMEKHYV